MSRHLVLILAIIVAGCGGAGGDTATADAAADSVIADGVTADADSPDTAAAPATLDLPPAPWWENDGLALDEDLLADQAGAWCAATGGAGGAPAFFFGAMPLEAVAALCEDGGPDPAVLLGHMYLSGYYGGLWFRDNADLGMGMGDDDEGGHPAGPVTEEEFRVIADNAVMLAALAATGEDAAVFAHNLESLIPPPGGDLMESMINALLTLFGYNYGYVQAILAKPPEGANAAGLSMPCDGYLDCSLEGTPLAVYSAYRVALERLAAPPNETWEDLAAEAEKSQGWVAIGEGLWSGGEITPAAWAILVDINAAYLRVTDVAVLASLLGAGDSDADAGRCALLLEAAADTWNRAYFMALGADAPEGTLPNLTCPN